MPSPTENPGTSQVAHRLRALLAVLSFVLALMSTLDGEHGTAAVWAAAGAFWAWTTARARRPPAPRPAHADEAWAARVLAEAGSPHGVGAVRALRDAEPALSLLQAKQLADAVSR